MKIISQHRDFYDYLEGIYGQDPKLVLDRREGFVVKDIFEKHTDLQGSYYHTTYFKLAICGQIIEGMVKDGKVYYYEELLQIGFNLEKDYYSQKPKYRNHINGDLYTISEKPYQDTENLNKKHDCPILMLKAKERHTGRLYQDGEPDCLKYPRLADFKMEKIYPAKELWIMLTDWLSQRITANEPPVPIGDDKIRIASHGFDVKTSFRPKMK
ncbi:MAG: hypothetical protein EXR21_09200 [Flavobacteriaceae bacterium]|nr:hypothetical protein [Flavobacteriaceae bacterium]